MTPCYKILTGFNCVSRLVSVYNVIRRVNSDISKQNVCSKILSSSFSSGNVTLSPSL